jgi:hypothetical protein
MSDAVAIALITAIPTTIATIGAIITERTRRKVKELDETVKREGSTTRAHVQTCCHPDDMPHPRSEGYQQP